MVEFSTADWETVPTLIRMRYKIASQISRELWPYECHACWRPLEQRILLKTASSELFRPRRVCGLPIEHTGFFPDDGESVQIKASAALSWLNKPYEWTGAVTGGPSPFTNGLVSAALGAGAGYVGGKLIKKLAPDKYIDTDNLETRLAVMGGLGGASLAAPQLFARTSLNRRANGKSEWLKSMFSPIESQPFAKKAASSSGYDMLNRPIPVNSFNQAIWNDVHNGPRSSMANPYDRGFYATPPPIAAATSGLVTGIQQMYGGSNLLTPRHFVTGLVTAGADLVTATLVGKTLGALGVITPKAQEKIQEMGIWGGLMRGVAGSVFGL